CLVLSFSSYSWEALLGKIQEEKYGVLHGGSEILVPMIVVSAGTSFISIISGVTHWEDSIAFYGPAILLSLQVSRSIPTEGRISPRFAREEIARLNKARSSLESRLSWTREQKDEYGAEEYQKQIDKLE